MYHTTIFGVIHCVRVTLSPAKMEAAVTQQNMQGRIQDFWKGGVQARIQDFSQAPPPLDIVRVTSSDLRKFEKHPTLGHSQAPPPSLLDIHKHPPPLGHCPRDVIRPQKIWKTPPLLDIHKRGGPTLGPMLKSLHRGPKGGGVRTPWTPPLDPPLIWISWILCTNL